MAELVGRALEVLEGLVARRGLSPPAVYKVVIVEDLRDLGGLMRVGDDVAVSDNAIFLKPCSDSVQLLSRLAKGYLALALQPLAGDRAPLLAERLAREIAWEAMVMLARG